MAIRGTDSIYQASMTYFPSVRSTTQVEDAVFMILSIRIQYIQFL